MIEHNFRSSECSKPTGFSGSQFEFNAEALHAEFFPLPLDAIYKSLRFSSFLTLEIKTKSAEPVEMWESQAVCRRGFSKQMRHFHQAGNSA